MTDQDLNNKLDRLLALMEAQLELSRQSHREERLRRAHHNFHIDIDRAEPPLNGVSTEVSRNLQ